MPGKNGTVAVTLIRPGNPKTIHNVNIGKLQSHPEAFMNTYAGGTMTMYDKQNKASTVKVQDYGRLIKQGYTLTPAAQQKPALNAGNMMKRGKQKVAEMRTDALQKAGQQKPRSWTDYTKGYNPEPAVDPMKAIKEGAQAKVKKDLYSGGLGDAEQAADYVMKHKGEMSASDVEQSRNVQRAARRERRMQQVGAELSKGVDIDSILKSGQESANKAFLTEQAQRRELDPLGFAGDPLAGIFGGAQKAQKELDPDKLTSDVLRAASSGWKGIVDQNMDSFKRGAAAEGMNLDDYIKSVGQHYLDASASRLYETLIQNEIPKTKAQWYVDQLKQSFIGNLTSAAVTTQKQKQVIGEARARNQMGEGYQAGWVDKGLGMAAQLAADTPLMMGGGAVANGVLRGMGLMSRAAIAGNTIRVANATLRGRIFTGLGTATLNSSMNLAIYDVASTFGNNLATDTHMTFSEYMGQAGHGAVAGAALGAFGKLYNNVFSPVMKGVTGVETSFMQRAIAHGRRGIYHTGGLLTEGAALHVGNALTDPDNPEAWTWGGYVKDVTMAAFFKLTPQHAAKVISKGVEFARAPGKTWGKKSDALLAQLSPEARKEIDAARGDTKFFDYIDQILKASDRLATEKGKAIGTGQTEPTGMMQSLQQEYNRLTSELSWDTQNALNTVLFGSPAMSRPRMQYIAKRDGKLYEVSKDGETLSVYKPTDAADEASWRKMKKNQRRQLDSQTAFWAASQKVLSKILTMDTKSDAFRNLVSNFMAQHPEYGTDGTTIRRTMRRLTDGRTEEGQAFMNWYLDNSEFYQRLDAAGLTTADIDKVLKKNPGELTRDDVRTMNLLQQISREIAFPKGEVHTEQAAADGANAAEAAGMGTENPNVELVRQISERLDQAQQRLDDFIKSDEAGSLYAEYVKTMTPWEAYVKLRGEDGFTEEQLAPIAEFLNADAAQRGFGERTEAAIDENASEWYENVKYNDSNGGEHAGSVVYVTDEAGHVFYVKGGAFEIKTVGGEQEIEVGEAGVMLMDGNGEPRFSDGGDISLLEINDMDSAIEGKRHQLQTISIGAMAYGGGRAEGQGAKPEQAGQGEKPAGEKPEGEEVKHEDRVKHPEGETGGKVLKPEGEKPAPAEPKPAEKGGEEPEKPAGEGGEKPVEPVEPAGERPAGDGKPAEVKPKELEPKNEGAEEKPVEPVEAGEKPETKPEQLTPKGEGEGKPEEEKGGEAEPRPAEKGEKPEEPEKPAEPEEGEKKKQSSVKEYLSEFGRIFVYPFGKQVGKAVNEGFEESLDVANTMLDIFKSANNLQEVRDAITKDNGWSIPYNILGDIKKFFEAYKRGEITDQEVLALFLPPERNGLDGKPVGGEQPKPKTTREEYPLTKEQIMADEKSTDDMKDAALDYLEGEDSLFGEAIYKQIALRLKGKEEGAGQQPAEEGGAGEIADLDGKNKNRPEGDVSNRIAVGIEVGDGSTELTKPSAKNVGFFFTDDHRPYTRKGEKDSNGNVRTEQLQGVDIYDKVSSRGVKGSLIVFADSELVGSKRGTNGVTINTWRPLTESEKAKVRELFADREKLREIFKLPIPELGPRLSEEIDKIMSEPDAKKPESKGAGKGAEKPVKDKYPSLSDEEKKEREVFDRQIKAQQEKQGEIKGKVPKQPDIQAFVPQNKSDQQTRPVMTGVYHDPDGYGVVTDGQVLYYDKALYDESNSGKTISTGVDKNRPEGEEIEGKYPNWKSVIPKPESIKGSYSMDAQDILEFASGIENKLKKEYKEDKSKKKESMNERRKTTYVAIGLPDGKYVMLSLPQLKRLGFLMQRLGSDTVDLWGQSREGIGSFHVKSDRGGALVLGLNTEMENCGYFYEAKSPRGGRASDVKPSSPNPIETAERIAKERAQEKIDAMGPNIAQAEAKQAEAEASQKRKDELKQAILDKLKGFKNQGKGEAVVSFLGMNNTQMETIMDVIGLSAQLGFEYIKDGVKDFERFAKKLAEDIGDVLRETTGWGEKDMTDFYKEVWAFKVKDEKGERKKLSEWASLTPDPSPKGEGSGMPDAASKRAEERTKQENDFVVAVMAAHKKGDKLDLRSLRKMAKEKGLVLAGEEKDGKKDGITDGDLQELAELAYVQNARRVMEEKGQTREAYDEIVSQYERQATVSKRDSDKIEKQQYSTPTPLSAIMALFGNVGRKIRSVLEPSAGNGALVFGFDNTKTDVNDIDPQRLSNLRRQGFRNVTSQDGTKPFREKAYDMVVTNPPFSKPGEKIPPKTVKVGDRVYTLTSLDHQMAANALDSMKDDGRAAIIVGGHTKYDEFGVLNGKDLEFLSYLYDGYNVVDIINIDGNLYKKNGTGYAVRMILIDGRRKDVKEQRYAPVKEEARAEEVKSWDELYKRHEENTKRLKERKDDDLRDDDRERDGHGDAVPGREGDARPVAGAGDAAAGDSEGTGGGRPGVSDGAAGILPERGRDGLGAEGKPGEGGKPSGTAGERPRGTGGGDVQPGGKAAGGDAPRPGAAGAGADAGGGRDLGGEGRPEQGGGGRPAQPDAQPAPGEPAKPALGLEKVPYAPRSGGNSLGTLTPASTVADVRRALEKIGDVDKYVMTHLGYANKNVLYEALGADQIDAVAMAIYQMEQGSGFIIGDGTGVGKGRQAAVLMRYAIRKGKTPIFVTQKPDLFSDIYRDFLDTDSKDYFKPFIINTSATEVNIKDDNSGDVLFKGMAKASDIDAVLEEYRRTGKLPNGANCVLVTYSQLQAGTHEYVNGQKRVKRKKDGKPFSQNELKGEKRREFFSLLARDNFVIMDESHTAAGATSGYFMDALRDTKGVTFLSGTFAKRPDSMPLYGMKTAISSAGRNMEELIAAVARGGVTLQEIMSQNLSKVGQMIRRERPMDGAVTQWINDENPESVERELQASDAITDIVSGMCRFQRDFIEPFLDKKRAGIRHAMGHIRNGRNKNMGISTMSFTSQTYNIVRQMSFALKADFIVEQALKALREGRKPIIAVSNTMESFLNDLPMNEDMPLPDFSESMIRKLNGLLYYEEGKVGRSAGIRREINLEELGEDAVKAYRELERKIDEASTGLSLSPIDYITHKIEEAGYAVGELTGRKNKLQRNDDGTVRMVSRTKKDTNKKDIVRRFNNNDQKGGVIQKEPIIGKKKKKEKAVDVIILNKSSATGISLHSNAKFGDTRQREMILGQLESDINDAIQMLGRVNRTGQVEPPLYTNITSNLPAEQRLLMMYKNKVKSLFANTTGDQKSSDNEVEVVDMLNKYGDQVCFKYLVEHPEVCGMMMDPLGWDIVGTETAEELMSKEDVTRAMERLDDMDESGAVASRVLSRLALLPVEEQKRVSGEIEEAFNAKMQILDETGENTLVATELPLKAKTKSSHVVIGGADPTGGNPFAADAVAETVEVDVLVKPMRSSEVQKAIDTMHDKSHDEWLSETTKAIDEKRDAQVEKSNASYDKAGETAYNRAKKSAIRELKNQVKDGRGDWSDEQIEQAGERAGMAAREQALANKAKKAKDISHQWDEMKNYLEHFKPGMGVSIPDKQDESPGDKYRPGIFIGFKEGKTLTPAATMAIFATADGRRKWSVQLNNIRELDRIIQATNVYAENCRAIKLGPNWDKFNEGTGTREERTIITGNILAYLMADEQRLGQIIRYTTEDGEVKTGVLLPKGAEAASRRLMTEAEGDLRERGDSIVSSDGNVVISHLGSDWRGEQFRIQVPSSRKEGGMLYLDHELTGMMDYGVFQQRGSYMVGSFSRKDLHSVLERLDALGVSAKTKSDKGGGVRMHLVGDGTTAERFSYAYGDGRLPDYVQREVPRLSAVGKAAAWSYDMMGEVKRAMGITGHVLGGRLLSPDDSHGVKVDIEHARQEASVAIPLVKEVRRRFREAVRRAESQAVKDMFLKQIERCNNTIEWYRRAEKGDASIFNDDKPRLQLDGGRDGASAYGEGVSQTRKNLRDFVVRVMQRAGVKVSTDWEEGQRVLNGLGLGGVFKMSKKKTASETAVQRELSEREVQNVVVDSSKRTDLPKTREEAMSQIPEGGKTCHNNDQDVEVRVSRTSLKHSTLHKDKTSCMAYGVIDEIIEKAVKIGNIPVAQDEIGHTNSVGIFYAPVNIDGKQYSARLVIKELANKGRVLDELSLYNVSLHKEKAPSTLLNASNENEAGQIYEGVVSAYKVKDLIHSSQEIDKKILGLGEDFRPKFFRTKSGEAYGFVHDGKIYIDPEIAGADTPIHEYTHLWAEAVRQSDPKAWERIVKLMKGQKELWDDVTRQYSDLKTDDEIADEVLAHYSGSRGESRLLEMFSGKQGLVERAKEAIGEFWRKVCGLFGVKYTSAAHVADTALKDLLGGVNPNDAKPAELGGLGGDGDGRDPYNPLETARRIARERREASERDHERREIGMSGKTFEELRHGTPAERSVLFSLKPTQYGDLTGEQQRIIYESALRRNTGSASWKEAFFDQLHALKNLQKALTGKSKKVLDAHNVYDKMVAMTSVIATQQFNLLHHHVEPCMDVLKSYVKTAMKDAGMKRKDAYQYVKEYVYTMSGMERNRILKIRDFVEEQRGFHPEGYDDLSARAQEIYKKKEDAVEWDALTPEEEKKERARILRESHEEWVEEMQNDWYDIVKDARKGTFNDYLDELDDFIKEFDDTYDPTEKKNDRSGVNQLVGGFDDKGHFDEQELRDNVEDAFSVLDPKSEYALWDRINDINQQTNDKQFESGLIDRGYKKHLDRMMAFYVPMRRWAEDTAEDVWDYRHNDFSNKDGGRIVMRAKGRKSMADDPLATMLQLANRAITLGEQNKVKNTMLRLVNATYDPADKKRLVSKSDTWLVKIGVDGKGKPIWDLSEPNIKDGMTPDEVADEVERWEEEMRQKKLAGEAKIAKSRLDVPYRFARGGNKNQHAIRLWANGKQVTLWINGDPRAAQAINGALAPSAGNVIDKTWGKAMRGLSAMYTSYSPSFAVRNIIRDISFGMWNVYAKEGWRYSRKVRRQWFKNFGRFALGGWQFGGYFKLYEDGKLDTKKKYQRYFKEFMDNGGKTGYVHEKHIREYKSELENAIKNSNRSAAMKFARKWTLGVMEHLNDRSENLLRFAVYVASREGTKTLRGKVKKPGKGILESIADAKDVSVNFNKKGAGFKSYVEGDNNSLAAGATAELIRQMYVFSNPAMQSIAILGRNFNFKEDKARATRATVGAFAHVIMGAMWPAIIRYALKNIYHEDEDDYANLMEYERRSSLCIPLGKGRWAKLPFGIENAAAWAMGHMFAERFLSGNEDLQNNLHPALDFASTLTALSPVDPLSSDGKSIVVSLSPTVIAPMVQAYTNTKWTGAPVEMGEERWTKGLPKYTRAYKSTPAWLVGMCRFLNDFTNGDGSDAEPGFLNFSPGQMDVLIQGYLGGPGKTVKDITNVATGDGGSMKKWPVLNGILTESSDEGEAIRISNVYRHEKEKIEEAKNQINYYKKHEDDGKNPSYTSSRIALEEKWGDKIEALKEAEKAMKEDKDSYYNPTSKEEEQGAGMSMTEVKRQFLIEIGRYKDKKEKED